MKFTAKAEQPELLPQVAKALLNSFPESRVFAFKADMGTGKTTFIKALCRELGVNEAMSSPTFSIVNEYRESNGESVFHFDFYRLKSTEEAFEAGLHELLRSGNYCFVEWPESAPEILPEETIIVTISLENQSRVFIADGA
jgi:tRNA threonylcarbamoyladenosine biosynthesis protein TsaE